MAPPRHGSSRLLLAACAFLLLLCRGGAVEHVVGDADFGWDSGINYAAWARKHTFAVGDVLVFQYVSSQHNVYEVTESSYRSCDGTGVVAKYTSGYDKVVLGEARSYWFICEFPGHCLGGMKVTVNVSAAAAPSPNAPPVPPTGSAAAASLAGAGCRGWLAVGLATGVLELMNRAIR